MQELTLGDQLSQMRLKTKGNFSKLEGDTVGLDYSGLQEIGPGLGLRELRILLNEYITLANDAGVSTGPVFHNGHMLWEIKKMLNVYFFNLFGPGPNIYVNPGFLGGSASGLIDGNNPPTSHTIGFNTVDSTPVEIEAGVINHWSCNPSGDTGRSYLSYNVHDNHPTLEVGDIIDMSYWTEDTNGVRQVCFASSNVTGVSITFGNQRPVIGGIAKVSLRAVVTDAVWTLQTRVGTGPTSNNTVGVIISDPVLTITKP